jgi:glycosyltransferase involved in cell wall biosynthesis
VESSHHLRAAASIVDAGLFHRTFYERQRSARFDSDQDALDDFLGEGASHRLSPHPLFDARFYLLRNPDVQESGGNPVLHYIEAGWREGRDPHPLFDGRWYVAQTFDLKGLNPLSHFLRYANLHGASPNRLFDTQLYLRENPDTRRVGLNPLEHYVLYGRDEGRIPDARLQPLLRRWRGPRPSLKRGVWKRPRSCWLLCRDAVVRDDTLEALRGARELVERRRFEVKVILDRDGPLRSDFERIGDTVCLEDYAVHTIANSEFELSSLRLVLFTLWNGARDVALWSTFECPALKDALRDVGVPDVAMDEAPAFDTPSVVDGSAAEPGAWRHASSQRKSTPSPPPRRVIVPCLDWSLSGVHTVTEALGKELIARGWDCRLLFTRGTIGVIDDSSTSWGVASLPYEFLDVSRCHSARERWAALIQHFEWQAPCVFLATFDDFANAIAPALSDRVGVVGWLQSDEPHYYESAYRLGRYWNATVCVSRHILDTITALNPALGSRASVIHNTTVRRDQVVKERAFRTGERLDLVYVGRLVQYQKRILDIIPLVRELERARVHYRFTLIGTSTPDDLGAAIKKELAEQCATGRVRLTGPLDHRNISETLAAQDVFVLLSDFEGLPVALVEAMAAGCVPVVAHVRSGVPDLVRHDDNGLILASRDYQAWAVALADLARDTARLARLSQAARHTIVEQFSVEAMADRFEALFTEVLRDIREGTWARPPALTWRNPYGDVLVPPTMQGGALD